MEGLTRPDAACSPATSLEGCSTPRGRRCLSAAAAAALDACTQACLLSGSCTIPCGCLRAPKLRTCALVSKDRVKPQPQQSFSQEKHAPNESSAMQSAKPVEAEGKGVWHTMATLPFSFGSPRQCQNHVTLHQQAYDLTGVLSTSTAVLRDHAPYRPQHCFSITVFTLSLASLCRAV